jgi:hypothetical protein
VIAEALALLLGSPAPAVEQPYVVEARYRRRRHRRPAAVYVPSEADLAPRKAKSLRIIQDESGRWIVLRSGPQGIEDVYSHVPPFNRSKP